MEFGNHPNNRNVMMETALMEMVVIPIASLKQDGLVPHLVEVQYADLLIRLLDLEILWV